MKTEGVVRLIRALQAEHEARCLVFTAVIELLEEVLEAANDSSGRVVSTSAAPSTVHAEQFGTWAGRVRQIIGRMNKSFTIQDVVGELMREAKAKPEGQGEIAESSIRYSEPIRRIISNEINKLRHAKKVEVIEAGAGSKSGVYRRVS